MIEIVNGIQPSSIEAMHRIHKAALPDDITPNLPASYYSKVVRIIADPRNGFIVRAGDSGFCWVVYYPDSASYQIGSHRIDLACALARFALTKPGLLLDLYGSVMGKVSYNKPVDPCPEIYSIAVDDGRRSSGLGRAMVSAAEEKLRQDGYKALLAKTASPQALKFYLREGFAEIGSQERGRRKLSILHKAF